MNCQETKERLGAYLDGELSPPEATRLRAHVESCTHCQTEAETLRTLGAAIAATASTSPPPELWDRLAHRLDAPAVPGAPRRLAHWLRRPVHMAALIGLAVGLGTLVMFLNGSAGTAQASPIDFSGMLDDLPADPQKAFSRFLLRYDATEIPASQARAFAPSLSFDVPATLPGGFNRVAVYGLRFGENTGVAALYERAGEFLAAVFHAPVHPEQFGAHDDLPCVLGPHRGQKVKVGEWSLVQVTDPPTCTCGPTCRCAQTCHCIVSRLDDGDLGPILSTVASGTPTANPDAAQATP